MPSLRSTRSVDDKKKTRETDDLDEEIEVDNTAGTDEEIEDEDEDEEEEAETRCICGQLDPPDENGLFIQCEKCQVWQHGYCVSITEDVPEKYWCEKCRPDLHTIIDTSEGKISKYLPVMKQQGTKRTSKKRQANNNSNEDLEDSHKKRKERATYNSREDARYEALIQRVMEESKKEVQTDIKSEDEEKASKNSRGSRRRNNEEENTVEEDTVKSEDKNSSSDLDKKSKDSDTNDSAATNTTTTTTSKRQQPGKRTRKAGPNSKTTKETNKETNSAIDFSKPTKPRLPQQRSTVNEMRKRVAAILEFIGRTQIDIANEQRDEEELTKFVEDESSKEKITTLFQNYNGSLELMDSLTRKLLIWEQKFGKYGDK